LISADRLILLAAGYLVVSALLRGWFIRRRFARAPAQATAWCILRFATVVRLAGAVALAGALWVAAPMFSSTAGPWRVLSAAFLLSASIQSFAEWKWKSTSSSRAALTLLPALVVAVAGGGLLGWSLFLRSAPSSANAERIQFPLKGTWRVASGGRTRHTNHHHNSPAEQTYAVDLVLASNEGGSEGQVVYSPVRATVHEVRLTSDAGGAESAEGNLVIMRTDRGTHIWLAHFQDGSVLVSRGDHVESGQPIAKVGSTGNANTPHLHIHGEHDGHAVPLLFNPNSQFLVRGDVINY